MFKQCLRSHVAFEAGDLRERLNPARVRPSLCFFTSARLYLPLDKISHAYRGTVPAREEEDAALLAGGMEHSRRDGPAVCWQRGGERR